ncbi:zinc finger protein-domain-containing protein [Delphinella strobiligena]|nr:zinc finger protein-domain-containing protein [Delphinella strobiligena]
MAAHSSSTHRTDQYNLYGEEAHRRDYARILTNIGQLWTYPEDNSEVKHESQTCPTYRRIGAGHCGSVWTSDISSLVVLKRGDGAETRHLWKEYYMQTRLLEALARIPHPEKKLSIHVPYCYRYTKESDTQWWSEQLARFQRGCRRVPQFLRYAETMAQSLAVMHWEAGLDAGDVEFVLGAPRSALQDQVELVPSSTIAILPYNSCTRWREPPGKTTTMTAPDTWCRKPHLHAYEASKAKTMATALDLWLLDFDCCSLITMDAHGIEKAASTFYRNDPYYPRPCSPESPDLGIWEVFRKSYLESSKRILERKNLEVGLAEMFIARLIVLDGGPKEIRNAPAYNTGHDSTFL